MDSNGKILVVEDNDFVRMQIVKYLRDADFETQESPAADPALELMQGEDVPFDLALVDVRMEPKGGFDFIRIIRGHGIETPVILVTGDQSADILENAGKLNVSAVLIKPVEKERLIKTVTRTVKAHRKR